LLQTKQEKRKVKTLPRNKYPEETIQKILDTSLKLFTEKGYEQTTVLDIVANLGGLTRGAFYHHFKSKEEVLHAIFDNDLEINNPFREVQNAKVANGLERVRLALKNALIANMKDERQLAISFLAISLTSNPRFLAIKLKGDQETAAMLAPLIAEGMADGSIRQGEPKMLAELFMMLVNFWMIPTIFPCTKEETLAKMKMIKDVCDGLGFPVVDKELEKIYKKVFVAVIHRGSSIE
jgi:AcrR family transcriptional regulator